MTTSSEQLITAALWRRLAAMLYDSFLIFAIWIMVGFVVLSIFGLEEARTIEGDIVVLAPVVKNTLFAAMMTSAFLFFGWFWTFSGQTLGMQAWRIRVVNEQGSSISWLQALIRFVCAPFALGMFAAGYLWSFFDSRQRSWPDIASNSRIVRTTA